MSTRRRDPAPTPEPDSEPEIGAGRDWRDTLRNGADLALAGIVTFVVAAPIVTAGAALATASAAIAEFCRTERFPSTGDSARRFGRGILPGLGASVVALVLVWLFALNLQLLREGTVPGGGALIAATTIVGVLVLGVAGLTLVEIGRAGGKGWRSAARAAVDVALRRPVVALAEGGVLSLAVLLAVLIPVCAPILLGYALFALHVVARRFLPA
ncbi:hypothetical protein [Luedemannella flava]